MATATAPATATVAAPHRSARTQSAGDDGQRIVLWGVSWGTYEALLADHADRGVPHFAYDRGVLEIVSPTTRHEERKTALNSIVDMVVEEFAIPHRSVGAMTYRRAAVKRGFEPDASFYLQSHDRVRGKRQIDPETDPPPDLLIEIDVTHASLDKLPLYAELGVPEVWRDIGDRVVVLVRRPDGGGYDEGDASRALPMLTAADLTRWLAESDVTERHLWLPLVRAWVRALAPSA